MKKRMFIPVFVLFFLAFSHFARAQEKVVQGKVTTFDSIPLIGASVKVQSTKQVVQTDSVGYFSVTCKQNDKLKVSAHGFYNQNVKLSGNIRFAAINLKLKPGEKSREIAIGYGYVSDADKLNAVASLTKDDTDFSRYNTIYDLISGRFAGVEVLNGQIIIRGSSSFNSGSAALIVVDGVVTDESTLATLKPIQVRSVNVIKDGSSAIYGSRGANGVVIIETKRGGD